MTAYIDTRELIDEVVVLGFDDPENIDPARWDAITLPDPEQYDGLIEPCPFCGALSCAMHMPEREQLETWKDLEDDERERIRAIVDLLAEVGSEARYGATLIPESDFVEYAQELAEDIGAIDAEASWPTRCIDWEQAADELRVDYTSVTFDGTDYLVRA